MEEPDDSVDPQNDRVVRIRTAPGRTTATSHLIRLQRIADALGVPLEAFMLKSAPSSAAPVDEGSMIEDLTTTFRSLRDDHLRRSVLTLVKTLSRDEA